MKEKLSVNVRFAGLKDLDFCIKSDFKHLTEAIVERKIEEKAVILAEVDGKLVGYLRLEYFWYAIPYLGNISVNKRYRRKGVGTAMIKFLEEHLLKQGLEVLYSSSEAHAREPQAWHRAVGFEECGFIASINPTPEIFARGQAPETVYAGRRGIGEIFFKKILKSQ